MSITNLIGAETHAICLELRLPQSTWISVEYWRKRRSLTSMPNDGEVLLAEMPWSVAVEVLRVLPVSTVWMAAARAVVHHVECATAHSAQTIMRWIRGRGWAGTETVGDVVALLNKEI